MINCIARHNFKLGNDVFSNENGGPGILDFCCLYLSSKCIKKTSWFMLYSGIRYVSPACDFCSKLRVLNLQKIEKKCIKMGIINRNSKAITVFSLPWPLQSAYFFPQQYRFSPFPGLYDYHIFLNKKNGFLPFLAFTNSSHRRRFSPKIDQNHKTLRNFNMNGAKNHRKSEKLLSFSGRPEHVGSMLAACWQHVGEHVSSRSEHVRLVF